MSWVVSVGVPVVLPLVVFHLWTSRRSVCIACVPPVVSVNQRRKPLAVVFGCIVLHCLVLWRFVIRGDSSLVPFGGGCEQASAKRCVLYEVVL